LEDAKMKKLAAVTLAAAMAVTGSLAITGAADAKPYWPHPPFFPHNNFYPHPYPQPAPGFYFSVPGFGFSIGPQYPRYRFAGNLHVQWCLARYKTYNPYTNTYFIKKGVPAVCYSPYWH
jgi:hypothetical protein